MSITTQVIILFLVVLVGILCRRLGYFNDATIHGVIRGDVSGILETGSYQTEEVPKADEAKDQ